MVYTSSVPLFTGQNIEELSEERPASAATSPTSSSGSRTTSPLTTSGGIITKRGPQLLEQNQVRVGARELI